MSLARLFLTAVIAAFLPCAAAAQWSNLPENDSKILVDAKRLGMERTQSQLGASSRGNTRIEYVVVQDRQKGSWVSIYMNQAHPGTYFRAADSDPRQATGTFSIYKDKSPTFERDGRTGHPLGSVRYVVAKLPDRECMLMTLHSGVTTTDRGSADGTNMIIYMNFCPPKGEPATMEAAQQVLAAINVR